MSQDREAIILSLFLTTAIFLTFLWLYLQMVIYTETPKYVDTLQEISRYHDVNLKLEDQLLHLQSYTYIASQATKQGFVPVKFITP